MNNLQKQLENLGLEVRVIRDVYVARTTNGNLLVMYFTYDELLEQNLWELEINNTNTVNCYEKLEDLVEALNNYLHPENWRK